MVAKSDVKLKSDSYSIYEELFIFILKRKLFKPCPKGSNSWIHTLFAESLHSANKIYHTKKLKKSCALKLDQQLISMQQDLTSGYLEILKQYDQNLNLPDLAYEQDNAPAHKSEAVRHFLAQKQWEVHDWPAYSPDQNPNEFIWPTFQKKTCEVKLLPGRN